MSATRSSGVCATRTAPASWPGVTQIGSVMGYYVQDGERVPAPGKLIYRGIDVEALIDGFVGEGRFGFEETAYLLLMGSLPTRAQLEGFQALLNHHHALPPMFTEDMIIKAPSPDVMNKLARSVLALYSYDDNPDDLSLANAAAAGGWPHRPGAHHRGPRLCGEAALL